MLKKIFDNMSTGIVILNSEAKVKFFNKYMDDFVKPEHRLAKDMGKLFGNMFTCIYTEDRVKGCGFTEHCPECPLRNSLAEIISDSRIVVFEKEFYMNQEGGGKFFGITMKSIKQNGKDEILLEIFEIKDKRIEEISKDYSQMKEKIEDYQTKSYRDTLTGLYNRNFFEEKIETLIFKNISENTPLTLIMLDLDNLKIINDTKGHQEGDNAIHALGEIVKSVINVEGSYSIRFGGDEFMLFLPLKEKEAFEKAQEILEKVKNSSKVHSVSIGIAERKNSEGLNSVYKKADEALYTAKKNGRGTVVIGK